MIKKDDVLDFVKSIAAPPSTIMALYVPIVKPLGVVAGSVSFRLNGKYSDIFPPAPLTFFAIANALKAVSYHQQLHTIKYKKMKCQRSEQARGTF